MKSQILASASLLSVANAALYPGLSPVNHTCVLQKPLLSCGAQANATNAYKTIDSCCTETFGGLLLSTQFWSTWTGGEKQGQLLPANSWSVHGLWPDFCNGSYTGYCDANRQYDPAPSPPYSDGKNGQANGTIIPPYKGEPVSNWLQAAGKLDLLDWMSKYWINQGAANWELWAHEFSKHATCFSTFDTPCYGPNYTQHADIIQYWESAIMYFNRLPTYDWLASAGIKPSNKTRVDLTAIQNALTKGYGFLPYVGCAGPKYNETDAGKGSTDNGRTVLSETWYYFYSSGRPQEGHWKPLAAEGFVTTCAKTPGAILYPERATGAEWSDSKHY